MDFSKYFDYKDGQLFWKEARGRVAKGDLAGRLTPAGYRHICLNGKEFYSHRIIWSLFNGEIPEGFEIDHQNRNKDDNRLENLRLVSSSENKMNRQASSVSKTKIKGVYWSKQKSKWETDIKVNCLTLLKTLLQHVRLQSCFIIPEFLPEKSNELL